MGPSIILTGAPDAQARTLFLAQMGKKDHPLSQGRWTPGSEVHFEAPLGSELCIVRLSTGHHPQHN